MPLRVTRTRGVTYNLDKHKPYNIDVMNYITLSKKGNYRYTYSTDALWQSISEGGKEKKAFEEQYGLLRQLTDDTQQSVISGQSTIRLILETINSNVQTRSALRAQVQYMQKAVDASYAYTIDIDNLSRKDLYELKQVIQVYNLAQKHLIQQSEYSMKAPIELLPYNERKQVIQFFTQLNPILDFFSKSPFNGVRASYIRRIAGTYGYNENTSPKKVKNQQEQIKWIKHYQKTGDLHALKESGVISNEMFLEFTKYGHDATKDRVNWGVTPEHAQLTYEEWNTAFTYFFDANEQKKRGRKGRRELNQKLQEQMGGVLDQYWASVDLFTLQPTGQTLTNRISSNYWRRVLNQNQMHQHQPPYGRTTLYDDVNNQMLRDLYAKEFAKKMVKLLTLQFNIKDCIKNFNFASSSLEGLFGNVLSFPTKSIIGVIEVGIKGLIASSDMVTGGVKYFGMQQGVFVRPFNDALDGKKKDNYADNVSALGDTKGVGQPIMKIITQGLILGVRQIGMAVQSLQAVITGSVGLLTSILSAIFGLLKTIAKTSKQMETISNILSLCLILFFMPFFQAFGEPLLEKVFQILQYVLDNGDMIEKYLNLFIDAQIQIISCLIDNWSIISKIAEIVLFEFIPAMLGLMCSEFLDMIEFFMDMFIRKEVHQEDFINLINQGIDLADHLLEQGILTLMLEFGYQQMYLIDRNCQNIMNLFAFLNDVIQVLLDIVAYIISHMFNLLSNLGALLGLLIGIIINLSFGLGGTVISQAVQMLGKKMATVAILEYLALDPKAVAIEQGGSVIGWLIGSWIFDNFFDKNAPTSFQTGGFIPATPGGMLIRVAEKETEYIIPESKIHMVRGHNNLVIEINGDVLGLRDKYELTQSINEIQVASRGR